MSRLRLPVRLSHLLRHCSVGAIVRGPDYLVTVKDTRAWVKRDGSPSGRQLLYVDQVRSALNIQQELWEPPLAREGEYGQIEGTAVPAVRFPAWMICPQCRALHYKPWLGLHDAEKPRCRYHAPEKRGEPVCKNRPELEQVPWVLVHPEGHLGDVPWHQVAHAQTYHPQQKQCRGYGERQPYLRLVDKGGISRQVRCEVCHASAPFPDGLRWPYGKIWRQPWLQEEPDSTEELAEVIEVNDTRVHSAVTDSAIIIPPESRVRKGSVVDRLYTSSLKRSQIARAKSPFARESAIRQVAVEFRCASDEVKSALTEIDHGYPLYGRQMTPGLLLESEYQALVEPIPNLADDEDFVTIHHSAHWRSFSGEIDPTHRSAKIARSVARVIAVPRLKEILVLKGFSRMGGAPVFPDIVGESSWLPALELFGEGIFFTFDGTIMANWERTEAVRQRATVFSRRFENSAVPAQRADSLRVDARFLLLHTLAHLLIRQLETAAGYPAAALKERIYSSTGPTPMAGILIYVAVPDVSGSLGGLAELAEPARFLKLLTGVFDHADWCSLDPVCAEHEGQGPNQLNRAACHGCVLVPETSCAYGNILLDRAFIKGELQSGLPALLDFVA